MSNLGMASKVQKIFSEKTVESEAEVIGYFDVKDELELLNEAYKSVLMIIYNNLVDNEKDEVDSFDELYIKVDDISNDNECMKYLKKVLNRFGYKSSCYTFKEFILKQKEISDFIEELQ